MNVHFKIINLACHSPAMPSRTGTSDFFPSRHLCLVSSLESAGLFVPYLIALGSCKITFMAHVLILNSHSLYKGGTQLCQKVCLFLNTWNWVFPSLSQFKQGEGGNRKGANIYWFSFASTMLNSGNTKIKELLGRPDVSVG